MVRNVVDFCRPRLSANAESTDQLLGIPNCWQECQFREIMEASKCAFLDRIVIFLEKFRCCIVNAEQSGDPKRRHRQ